MKLIYTFASLFLIYVGSCQAQHIYVSQINKLLKSSISQTSKKNIEVGSGEWLICNQDSAFFKNDTLILYDNRNYFYQLGKCCDFIGWTFYKKGAFLQSKLQTCNEPSSRSAYTEFYEVKVVAKQKSTYLLISKKGVPSKNFEITNISKVALANNNFSNMITVKKTK